MKAPVIGQRAVCERRIVPRILTYGAVTGDRQKMKGTIAFRSRG